MRRKVIGILMLTVLGTAALTAHSAWADKGGNPHKDKAGHSGKSAAAEKSHGADKSDDETIFGFNDKEVEAVTSVLKHLYGGEAGNVEIVRPAPSFCPPGLAKKNNGCLPPGLTKKYSIGAPLADDVAYTDLPKALRDVLGVPSHGKKYVQVDKDVLLIDTASKLVLDAIGVGK
ncbi:MAG: hypothetical protein LRY54_00180 [Alphaproteobacteria bacterium]|nr:hypothetical protein [Alphaproteobacteria bacterium]